MSDIKPLLKPELELWAGIECTINRVGDQYYDQLLEGGFYQHPETLDRVRELNVKTFRYPVLWERHERTQGQVIDWTFTRAGLNNLINAGITPVVGLLHHGSGPEFTNLLDEDFAIKFQRYACKFAEAFPDIGLYTPINEPLTTARFSGLYGFWFPHTKDPLNFARMLLNQLKGVILAMQAIRSINPLAKLVQTEDLAKTHSTDRLKYQADFENVRRWLTFDLLCGKVSQEHPMWHYLQSVGIEESELSFFLKNVCQPDILGLNYYVTSERFLDHRCDLYPNEVAGSNGIDKYIDIAACRGPEPINLEELLLEAWSRYKIPLVITEAHLACTREEQLRWFKEVWDSARRCANRAIDIRAVTAWSVFGAFDWDSLMTARHHHYESGAFNNENHLRPTALATMLATIGRGKNYQHPLLTENGWWRPASDLRQQSHQPLLVVGQSGSFTAGLFRVCAHRRIHAITLPIENTDLENMSELLCAVSKINPWGIIDAMHMVDADERNDNVLAAIVSHNLATVSALIGIPHMLFAKCLSIKRSDNHRGANKVNANCLVGTPVETLVAKACPTALIIRTADTFSPWDAGDFTFEIVEALKSDRALRVPTNIKVTPTYLPHLLNNALDLFIDMECGAWALTNHQSSLSWSEFATNLAQCGGFSRNKLIHTKTSEKAYVQNAAAIGQPSVKSVKMPNLNQAIEEYLVQLNY